jgi:DNA-binding transcriptional LysR family regulator
MNLNLDDLAFFVRIVELGSLSAAARERNVAVSQATRAVARLEAECRARLLHRSTHGLSLTDEGDGFLAHARRLLDTAAEMKASLAGPLAGPGGWVRLSVSAVLAQSFIAPSVPSLHERYPNLQLDICTDDRTVDMAREGIDVAIRTGTAGDNLVARPLGMLSRSLYAAPGYLQRFGEPRSPADLARHRLLANTASPSLNRWPRSDGDVLAVQGHTRTDSTAVVTALAVNGAGIARMSDLVGAPLVRAGLLVRLLAGHFDAAPVPMYAVMLQERHRLPKVRACIEHWAEWLARLNAVA